MSSILATSYHSLPAKDRACILGGVNGLVLKTLDGIIPSPEDMLKAAEESGHRDLFLGLYGAYLMGEDWMLKSTQSETLSEGYIIRWYSKEYDEVETDSYPYKKPVWRESGNGLEIQSLEQATANCEILNKSYPTRSYRPFWVTQEILNNAEQEGLDSKDTVSQHLLTALTESRG